MQRQSFGASHELCSLRAWSAMKPLAFALIALLLSCRLATAAVQEIVLLTLAKPGSPQRVVADAFKELLERQAGDSFLVLIDPAGLRSGEAKAVEEVQTNGAQMAVLPAPAFERFDPIVRVVAFPFLFRDEQQAATILDGPLGGAILRDIETIGCKGLAFAEGGFRHLSNNIRPVKTLDDLKGLNIRTPSSPINTALWLTLGASPTPRPWPIYAELEQGLIEGQESPLWLIEKYSLHTVQRHLSLTRHSYTAHLAVASLKWWNTLTPTDQARLQAAMTEATARQRLAQRSQEAARLTLFAQQGMAIEAQPDIETFRARTAELKEMADYREPRLQALLTKMQEAALLPAPDQAQPATEAQSIAPANLPQEQHEHPGPPPQDGRQESPQASADRQPTALELLDADELLPPAEGQPPAAVEPKTESEPAAPQEPPPGNTPANQGHAAQAAQGAD